MLLLHYWQQLDLDRLMHVADHHLFRNYLIVLTNILISNDYLLHG